MVRSAGGLFTVTSLIQALEKNKDLDIKSETAKLLHADGDGIERIEAKIIGKAAWAAHWNFIYTYH